MCVTIEKKGTKLLRLHSVVCIWFDEWTEAVEQLAQLRKGEQGKGDT